MKYIDTVAAFLLVAGALSAPHRASAETFNTCAGFIDTVPTTISTQGVWCLRHDLATNVTSGAAITSAANNVTIDCNDFKIGGLAAGPATQTSGIQAVARENPSVRNCNVRGFLKGIDILDSHGTVIEHNRLQANTAIGILASGGETLIRDNQVKETGGGHAVGVTEGNSYGPGWSVVGIVMRSTGTIAGNIVDGVSGDGMGAGGGGLNKMTFGILATSLTFNTYSSYAADITADVSDNRVHAVDFDTDSTSGNPFLAGIVLAVYGGVAQGNIVTAANPIGREYGYSIAAWLGAARIVTRNNTTYGYASNPTDQYLKDSFIDAGGNAYYVAP
jgi:hypothetical protein